MNPVNHPSNFGTQSYIPPFIQFIEAYESLRSCTRNIDNFNGRLLSKAAADSICKHHADKIRAFIMGDDLKTTSVVKEKIKLLRGYNMPPVSFDD